MGRWSTAGGKEKEVAGNENRKGEVESRKSRKKKKEGNENTKYYKGTKYRKEYRGGKSTIQREKYT